ncbi:hypothetical protein C8R31_106148 [Nitrosospira sp. Nsp2]|uniref:hypothetical protein n=1 Tax=Nitrosospira sp. Nsp2 TaxID=136548 RepID=UPI000D326FA8|nr:hypothetical protein [Nitrosospira sp. Nsp2]PTR14475.1 hypothetical protein C8R31_106148 [Nitrosospira sp. Nsp2]
MSSGSSLLGLVSTLIVGIAATYISWQQWKTNKLKLKLDLYDRRVRIYEVVKNTLQLVLKESNVSPSDLSIFWTSASQADFLFGPEIPEYIDEIHKHGVRLHYWNSLLRAYNDSNQTPGNRSIEDVTNGMNEELLWFAKQFDPAREKFQKYLAMHN